ncbi:MAG: CDP-diacylglycerol--glycerol-3-phosphate 3-phosphatidyltransferase [Verrucomicrobiales bacterium]|nr:CDP-diacylglycerol--glycerol-3-phosphate 3-phosphatidyltransferase [Verrucomicrobiales bacterium]
MNLPNQLTVLRLILTFAIVGILAADWPFAKSLALLLFGVASFTDFLDGHLARKHNLITNFGKLMDPLADKVLMCGGFVMLVALDQLPAWIVVVILTREFLVTGLRLVASAEGVVLAAENLGKHKTIWQIVTVIYFLLFLASQEVWFGWTAPLFSWKPTSPAIAGQILIYLSLLLTVLSGWSYAWKNRKLLADC